MRLELNQFAGMAPLVDPTALADRLSTFAKNVRFDQGVLSPDGFSLSATTDYPDTALSATNTRSVAKLFASGTRFALTDADGADAFVSPVAPTDRWGRAYFMSAGGPAFTTKEQYTAGGLAVNPTSFPLGVPAPAEKPVVSSLWLSDYALGEPIDTIAEDDPDYVFVAYVYTFVDRYGHESAPSPPSETVRIAYNRQHSVVLDVTATRPPGVNFDDTGSEDEAAVRLYRGTFDGNSSVYHYVNDHIVTQLWAEDTIPLGQEAETLVSETWLPAPSGIKGLCLVGSSFAAGHLDHYVCYSDLKLPHAWPAELQYPIKYVPMAIMPMASGLLVVTNGHPYWAEGFDPYSAIPREIPLNAPCISGESLVHMDGRAFYMSEEGIVAFRPGAAEVISTTYMDRLRTLELVDGTCKAFDAQGRYVFSTKDDRWLAFDAEAGLVELDFGIAPSSVASISYSVRDNLHYFALTDGRIRVVDYATVATNVTWHSKHWRTPPVSFSCVRVEADTYPVVVTVRSKYLAEPWIEMPATTVTGPHIHRLPPDVGMLWQVEVTPPDGGRVYRVVLAQSGLESA